ncbi:hypothetical protein SBDP2_490002 [Syntrophobacter sp. SbD2]|nr:hypothetical protein SBDP2_490002 [Syntrophobacter sp. SbD2]
MQNIPTVPVFSIKAVTYKLVEVQVYGGTTHIYELPLLSPLRRFAHMESGKKRCKVFLSSLRRGFLS